MISMYMLYIVYDSPEAPDTERATVGRPIWKK